MFCTACAASNPATLPRCGACGASLRRETSPVAGLLGRRKRQHGRSRRRHLRRTLSILPLVVAIAVGSVAVNAYRAERETLAAAYARAETALQSGDYAAAISAFAEAGGYRDAAARRAGAIDEIAPYRSVYLAGVDALNAGDYAAAIDAFVTVVRDIPVYEDAAALLAEARRRHAENLREELALAEARHDWLAAERILRALLLEEPGDERLTERLVQVQRTHAPMVFSRNGALYTIGPDLLDEQLITDEVSVLWPNWSPDRTRIAFYSSLDAQTTTYGIYVVNADGSGLTQVADHVYPDDWPAWSPDGTKIAYIHQFGFDLDKQRGVTSIRVVDLTTMTETDLTATAYHLVESPTWSPRGDRIAFISKRIYNRGAAIGRRLDGDIHIVDVATGAITETVGERRLPFADYAAWSPIDEKLLVLSSELGSSWYETMITTIQLVDLPTGRIDDITERSQSVSFPMWSPDGERYAFVEGNSVIQIRTVEGARTWINVPREIAPFLTWSPDGSMLIAPAVNPQTASLLVPLDGTGVQADLALQYDFAADLAGPPQWAGTRSARPPAPPSVAGTALDG